MGDFESESPVKRGIAAGGHPYALVSVSMSKWESIFAQAQYSPKAAIPLTPPATSFHLKTDEETETFLPVLSWVAPSTSAV
jgi:hypothetical protein